MKVSDREKQAKNPRVYEGIKWEWLALKRLSEGLSGVNTRYLVPLLHSWTRDSYVYLVTVSAKNPV